MKDEIRSKYNVINIFFQNFSNRVQKRSNYITSKNTEVSTYTDQQIKNKYTDIQSSNNHHTIIVCGKESNKNYKKLNINQLNGNTCDKIHGNENSYNNNEDRKPLDQDDKKSEKEEIAELSNPNILCTVIDLSSTMKHLHRKSIAIKTSSDKIILVKPFPGSCKSYVSPDLGKTSDLVIMHTYTGGLKSVNSPEELVNGIISLALSVKKRNTRLQFAVSPKKQRMLLNVRN